MHKEEAPTRYVCAKFFFSSDLLRDRKGNGNVHVSWKKIHYGDRRWTELAQLVSSNGFGV